MRSLDADQRQFRHTRFDWPDLNGFGSLAARFVQDFTNIGVIKHHNSCFDIDFSAGAHRHLMQGAVYALHSMTEIPEPQPCR
jgi:hypothetical protein